MGTLDEEETWPLSQRQGIFFHLLHHTDVVWEGQIFDYLYVCQWWSLNNHEVDIHVWYKRAKYYYQKNMLINTSMDIQTIAYGQKNGC